MTENDHPLSHPFRVDDIEDTGSDITLTATPEQCTGIAAFLKIPAVHGMKAQMHLVRSGSRVTVTGRLKAQVRQICVVSLDEFDSPIDEPIEILFDKNAPDPSDPAALRDDSPDPIIGGVVDLGQVAVEFLALGLDPYPRKPGVVFEYREDDGAEESPFAKLVKLKSKPD